MRFMILVKTAENCGPVPQPFLDAISKAGEDAIRSGSLIETGALAATARSSRVRLSDRKITVTDGPFTEVKEVVGGYAVVEASSKEEAVEGVQGLVNLYQEHWPSWEGELEVRPILAPGEFVPGAEKP